VVLIESTVPHAFDKLVRTVDAIIHVATPLSNGDFQNTVIDPTWTIDESILSAAAAAQAPSVKRVIITGSIVSTMMIPDHLFKDFVISEQSFNSITDKEPMMTPAGSYQYAKTAAEKKAWAWVEANKPKFDLVVLLAPSITGRCIQEGFVPVKSALGGMGDIYRNIFDVETPGFLFPYFM
jgi:NADPH-dependent methylglyoxal reductase